VPSPPHAIDRADLIAWLAEAYLCAHPGGPKVLRTVLDSTSLFPFHMGSISGHQLTVVSTRLEVLQQGVDQELITLKVDA